VIFISEKSIDLSVALLIARLEDVGHITFSLKYLKDLYIENISFFNESICNNNITEGTKFYKNT